MMPVKSPTRNLEKIITATSTKWPNPFHPDEISFRWIHGSNQQEYNEIGRQGIWYQQYGFREQSSDVIEVWSFGESGEEVGGNKYRFDKVKRCRFMWNWPQNLESWSSSGKAESARNTKRRKHPSHARRPQRIFVRRSSQTLVIEPVEIRLSKWCRYCHQKLERFNGQCKSKKDSRNKTIHYQCEPNGKSWLWDMTC